MNLETVFVYGSLKEGFHNHSIIQDAICLGRAITKESYLLMPGPGFPYLLKAYNDFELKPIIGEIYGVGPKTFARIDQLEGNGIFYQREKVHVHNRNGQLTKAWAYFLMNERDLPNELGSSNRKNIETFNDGSSYYSWTGCDRFTGNR